MDIHKELKVKQIDIMVNILKRFRVSYKTPKIDQKKITSSDIIAFQIVKIIRRLPMTEKKFNLIFDLIKNTILIFLVIITLYPFLNIMAISFNNSLDSIRGHLGIWPRIFTLKNYIKLLSQSGLKLAFINSLLRVIIGVSTGVVFNGIPLCQHRCRLAF